MITPKVALLEYFTSASYSLVFLVKKGLSKPLTFELRHQADHQPITQDELLQCAERLMLDFHGLPPNWESPGRIQRFRQLLALPPAVSAVKRSKELLQINLNKPAFSYETTYWERLSDALLPAELREQISDCDLLCFIPHGPLHLLPFAALRWSPVEYLIERFGICYVLSAAVLRYCQSKNRKRTLDVSHGPTSCFIAAVAAEDDHDPQEFEADGETLTQIFQEKGLGDRVTALVGAQPAQNRLPASKALIQQRMGGFDIVHLACHGLFEAEGPGSDALDSGLLVSDGEAAFKLADIRSLPPAQRASHFLTAREILGLELSADLVTLRACSSGRAEIRSGDEIIGLTRAFLYAGAPSLIVSLWNVNKSSSRRLLDYFYRFWLSINNPLPKWQALQQAQIKILRDPDPRYSHPYHWAAFVLIGDWL